MIFVANFWLYNAKMVGVANSALTAAKTPSSDGPKPRISYFQEAHEVVVKALLYLGRKLTKLIHHAHKSSEFSDRGGFGHFENGICLVRIKRNAVFANDVPKEFCLLLVKFTF